MNKADFIEKLSRRLDIPKVKCNDVLNTTLEVISDVLAEENTITFQNFGTLSVWKQSLREGRNPRTGKACVIPPRSSVKFKPGKALLRKMNRDQ